MDLSITDTIDDYLQHCAVERGLSNATIEAYRNDLGKLATFLALHGQIVGVEQITRTHLLDWLKERTANGDSPATQARRLASVCGLFSWLRAEGTIKESPTCDIERPRETQRLPDVLSADEIEAMLAIPDTSTSLGLRDVALLEFMYGTGCRVSEACRLDLAMLDLSHGMAVLDGKGNKQRAVPVVGAAQEAMHEYLARGRPKLVKSRIDSVFVNRFGKRLTRTGWYAKLRTIAVKAGITRPVSPHKLRHTCATHLVQGDADLVAVQALLGHADISTVEIYTHLDQRHIRREYDEHHPRA